jgi:hypothetical protein
MKPKDKISKEELIKIQTSQTYFLQPSNKIHKDKSKYTRKNKHKGKNY